MRSSGCGADSSRAACKPVMRGIETSSTARWMSSDKRELDRLGAIARLGHHLEVRLGVEHHAQALANHGVVVREQDPRLQRGGHELPPRPAP